MDIYTGIDTVACVEIIIVVDIVRDFGVDIGVDVGEKDKNKKRWSFLP